MSSLGAYMEIIDKLLCMVSWYKYLLVNWNVNAEHNHLNNLYIDDGFLFFVLRYQKVFWKWRLCKCSTVNWVYYASTIFQYFGVNRHIKYLSLVAASTSREIAGKYSLIALLIQLKIIAILGVTKLNEDSYISTNQI